MKRLHAPVYASRLAALVKIIRPHLHDNDQVLDVGCGFGTLGRALMDAPDAPANLAVRGLERVPRDNAVIPVDAYPQMWPGVPPDLYYEWDQANPRHRMPYDDRRFDVVILADVLHHETQPLQLLAECVRVCRRVILIKDHILQGPLAQQRISLLDWAANAPYGVPCLYRYNTPQQWTQWRNDLGLTLTEERRSMRIYPRPYEWFLGGNLHYFAAWTIPQ